ncbi:hypothetical protein UPYG_G00189560 [Umbra pygmaea]|uniref:TopBP1/SLF1 BRCT domain-containing protein n=1 Tax=Umbra pygmaea TaxID=75934 RepID=A0ABD0XB34_UMBPY
MVKSQKVFQISGIKNLHLKGKLLHGIHQLRGNYIGGSVYNHSTTHLIVSHAPMASEKFLAACAGGKWIVTPNYIFDSHKNGSWLTEGLYEVDASHVPGALNPVKVWRERVTRGEVAGAFEGWRVLLVAKPTQTDIFKRILKAGKATVQASSSPSIDNTQYSSNDDLTHVLTSHVAEHVKIHNASVPCYSIKHIAHHLLGEDLSFGMDFTRTEEEPVEILMEEEPNVSQTEEEPVETLMEEEPNVSQTEAEPVETLMEEEPNERQTEEDSEPNDSLTKEEAVEGDAEDFTELEVDARNYMSQIEERRLFRQKLMMLPEILSYNTPGRPTQMFGDYYHNVQNLTDCGFFTEAVEELRWRLQPGNLPSASFLHPLMQHALHGEAKPLFYRVFHTLLNTILRNNPPWCSPASERFYLKVLQCPECEKGVWPLLETSLRYCMGSELTCHSLPGSASLELLRFHGDLQAFMVKLFKCDIHSAINGRDGGVRSNVLNSVFWSVWDRSTLGSKPVQQVAQLLIQASVWMGSVSEGEGRSIERNRRQRLVLTLQDILGVVVDYWCQKHCLFNRSLVDNGMEDLAQHISILCQDLSPALLQELIPGMVSTRLRMLTANYIYRLLCCRNHISLGSDALSLRTIVSSYLPALGKLSAVRAGGSRYQQAESRNSQSGDEHASPSMVTQGPASRMPSGFVNGAGRAKEDVLRGLNRINAAVTRPEADGAGETILHRVCKRNQVETLLQILALPGIDVNVKDHAGWTPLHEACNHGSSACVEALLRHFPGLHLKGQVDGVSPLQDSLLCGHVDIAKMLLQHAGSDLLEQRDVHGRTPLDLVTSAPLREELKQSALIGDAAMKFLGSEVRDLPFLEACSCLLNCLLLTYQKERAQVWDAPLSLGGKLAKALKKPSAQKVRAGWDDPELARLVEDLETLLGVDEHLAQLAPALRECQGANTRLLITLLEDMKEHTCI